VDQARSGGAGGHGVPANDLVAGRREAAGNAAPGVWHLEQFCCCCEVEGAGTRCLVREETASAPAPFLVCGRTVPAAPPGRIRRKDSGSEQVECAFGDEIVRDPSPKR